MRAVKSKDTSTELRLRSELFRRGFRYRTNYKTLPGRPDIVFVRHKLAIFVDGGFWHGYKFAELGKKLSPYWQERIKANMRRDKRVNRQIRALGWRIVRIWEIDTKKDLNKVADKIQNLIDQQRST